VIPSTASLALINIPQVPGLAIPRDLYWVLSDPAPLAGMIHPPPRCPWQALGAAGLSRVVCLTDSAFTYDPAPLQPLLAVALEDLAGKIGPANADHEERSIQRAARVIAAELQAGEGVVVHCEGGTGRTGAVLGCTLRLLGYPTSAVLGFLQQVNRARGKAGWPESPWQAAVVAGVTPPQ
jgi:hypothetical protein